MIVNEKHLTQNFWAVVKKEDDYWRICKMEGQHFFPTPGTNKSLVAIYLAATGQPA